jgi:hypothetical protein
MQAGAQPTLSCFESVSYFRLLPATGLRAAA